MKLIRLTSDNYENQLMTVELYEKLKLQMSSGDFGSHIAEEVIHDGKEEYLEYFCECCLDRLYVEVCSSIDEKETWEVQPCFDCFSMSTTNWQMETEIAYKNAKEDRINFNEDTGVINE